MSNAHADNQRTEVYMSLRRLALETSPASIGTAAAPKSKEAYGILMEMGFPGGTATLVSFASGDASLYFSTGGGVIGGGGHENVRDAAKRFVSAAQSHADRMEATTSYPLPAAGQVRFYILTPQGILTSEANERDLGKRESELSPLFYAGQAVITALRIVSEKNPKR